MIGKPRTAGTADPGIKTGIPTSTESGINEGQTKIWAGHEAAVVDRWSNINSHAFSAQLCAQRSWTLNHRHGSVYRLFCVQTLLLPAAIYSSSRSTIHLHDCTRANWSLPILDIRPNCYCEAHMFRHGASLKHAVNVLNKADMSRHSEQMYQAFSAFASPHARIHFSPHLKCLVTWTITAEQQLFGLWLRPLARNKTPSPAPFRQPPRSTLTPAVPILPQNYLPSIPFLLAGKSDH